jgi:hypothetical protein
MTPASAALSRLALGLLFKGKINATSYEPGGAGVGLLGVALS